MKLSREEVIQIAQLSRLHLSDEDIVLYQEQLSSILEHIQKLSELDTSNVQPLSSIEVPKSPLRPDVPRQGLSNHQLLSNAPKSRQNQFEVPAVFDRPGDDDEPTA